jgi:hypothetical protein
MAEGIGLGALGDEDEDSSAFVVDSLDTQISRLFSQILTLKNSYSSKEWEQAITPLSDTVQFALTQADSIRDMFIASLSNAEKESLMASLRELNKQVMTWHEMQESKVTDGVVCDICTEIRPSWEGYKSQRCHSYNPKNETTRSICCDICYLTLERKAREENKNPLCPICSRDFNAQSPTPEELTLIC